MGQIRIESATSAAMTGFESSRGGVAALVLDDAVDEGGLRHGAPDPGPSGEMPSVQQVRPQTSAPSSLSHEGGRRWLRHDARERFKSHPIAFRDVFGAGGLAV